MAGLRDELVGVVDAVTRGLRSSPSPITLLEEYGPEFWAKRGVYIGPEAPANPVTPEEWFITRTGFWFWIVTG